MKRIVLISCVSQKQSYPCRAEELYTSTLFRKNLTYARSLRPDAIYVLSAKYGLVGLDTVIEPYDLTLNTMSAAERKTWAKGVLQQLGEVVDLSKDHFVFLAGDKYRRHLLPQMASYDIPLEGMPIGKQLQALTTLAKP
jgi:hypothetical protein